MGIDLELQREYDTKLKKMQDLMLAGVDEDSENKELAEEYKEITAFIKKNQAKLNDNNNKLDKDAEYQRLFKEQKEKILEARDEVEAELNKEGFTLGSEDVAFLTTPGEEKTKKIYYYDAEGVNKLRGLGKMTMADDPVYWNDLFLDKPKKICCELFKIAAEKAGVSNIHGFFQTNSKGEAGRVKYSRTASIEDYQEAIKKLRAFAEKDDSIFTLENVKENKAGYKQEAIDSGEIKQVLKEIFLNGLKFMEDNFENQILITHKPLSNKYTEAARRKYNEIKEAMSTGKVVTFATKSNAVSDQEGRNGEYFFEGMYDTHAFTVLGVKEIGDRLFVRARNPWGKDMVKYVEGENGTVKYDHDDSYERNGVGLIEFNHLLSRAYGFYIQK